LDIFKMMGKARELQAKMAELQAEVKTIVATGQSGAGAVTARVDGTFALVGLTVEKELLKPDEAEIVEDLIVAAYNDARAKVEVEVQAKTQGMMGDMGIPAGFKLPFG
jgi:nucleoid-associated protein EbfC